MHPATNYIGMMIVNLSTEKYQEWPIYNHSFWDVISEIAIIAVQFQVNKS
jgi:hypothetical protein